MADLRGPRPDSSPSSSSVHAAKPMIAHCEAESRHERGPGRRSDRWSRKPADFGAAVVSATLPRGEDGLRYNDAGALGADVEIGERAARLGATTRTRSRDYGAVPRSRRVCQALFSTRSASDIVSNVAHGLSRRGRTPAGARDGVRPRTRHVRCAVADDVTGGPFGGLVGRAPGQRRRLTLIQNGA